MALYGSVMPNKTTYYSHEELEKLEELEAETGESFSGLVREAIQEKYL